MKYEIICYLQIMCVFPQQYTTLMHTPYTLKFASFKIHEAHTARTFPL